MKHWFAVFGAMLAGGLWVPLYGSKVGQGWLYGRPIFLHDRLGWTGTLIITLSFLTAFYIFVTWIEKRAKKKESQKR